MLMISGSSKTNDDIPDQPREKALPPPKGPTAGRGRKGDVQNSLLCFFFDKMLSTFLLQSDFFSVAVTTNLDPDISSTGGGSVCWL